METHSNRRAIKLPVRRTPLDEMPAKCKCGWSGKLGDCPSFGADMTIGPKPDTPPREAIYWTCPGCGDSGFKSICYLKMNYRHEPDTPHIDKNLADSLRKIATFLPGDASDFIAVYSAWVLGMPAPTLKFQNELNDYLGIACTAVALQSEKEAQPVAIPPESEMGNG